MTSKEKNSVTNPNTAKVEPTALEVRKDSGNESIIKLLDGIDNKYQSIPSRVRAAVDKPDEDDEKEDTREAKETKRWLKNVARRIVPYWDVKVWRGEYRGTGTNVFGVTVTSKQYEGASRTYTLDYLEEKDQGVINDLRNIGSFRPSDYGNLVEYVRQLIEEGKVTIVDSLSEQLNDCLPEAKAKELFDFMVIKVIENLSLFPPLSSNRFALSLASGDESVKYYGVQLDTKEYVDRFALDAATGDVVAFGVTTKFLTDIFEVKSHKVARFCTLIRSWRAYGLISRPATYDGRHVETIYLGGPKQNFYLFCVGNFNQRKEAVKASLRYNKHAE